MTCYRNSFETEQLPKLLHSINIFDSSLVTPFYVFVAQLLSHHHLACASTRQSAPSWSCCRPLCWPLACIWRHLMADYEPTENNKSLSVDNGAINSVKVPTDSSRLRSQPVFETVFKRLSIFAQTDQRPSQEISKTIRLQAVRPTKLYLPL